MSIIYKKHMELLEDSMRTAKEFADENEMKDYIVSHYNGMIEKDDIILQSKEAINDDRIGWNNVIYVCVTKFKYSDGTEEKYSSPQCIGMCSYDYVVK